MTDPVADSPPVALVTGAARGIGAATAQQLAAEGWKLVLVDRCADDPGVDYPLATRDDLEQVVAGCGSSAIGVVADVRFVDALEAAAGQAVEAFGGLDAVVAAAAVISGGPPVWEMAAAAWQTQLDVVLTGVWNTVRATVPALLARPEPRRGRIVAVASAAGLGGNERVAAYNAAKAGVIGLMRGLAADLADTGVTANAVCPGSTRTAMLDHSARIYGLADVEEFAVHHLQRRLLTPDEVAAAIAWLCSPAASGVTGVALPVDAGMTV